MNRLRIKKDNGSQFQNDCQPCTQLFDSEFNCQVFCRLCCIARMGYRIHSMGLHTTNHSGRKTNVMITTEHLEQLRHTLFTGQYNLLLGSGISLDSFDKKGVPLKSARTLTAELCALKDLDAGTRLQRVSILLDDKEIDKYLTQPYLGCRAGVTVKKISSFVWKNIFTFNIDDALEAAYESNKSAKQKVETLNFDSLFKTQSNRATTSIIHLHGHVREPEKGYVFSSTQYGQVTRSMCAWMHALSNMMASESFIISGTSLDESDLEYYLAGRTSNSGKTKRGPSFLVEPYPNKITEAVCRQHGLLLVKATLLDFLKWITEKIGDIPTVTQLTVPSIEGIFNAKPIVEDQLNFFECFELVRPSAPNSEGDVPYFYLGRHPRWSDFESSIDVPTDDERRVSAIARNWLNGAVVGVKIINVCAEAGNGKSTILRRVGYDMVKEGHIVLSLNQNSPIDPKNVASVISLARRPITLLIDGLADNAAQIREALVATNLQKSLLIISADRDYRKGHIDRLIGDFNIEYIEVSQWSVDSYEKLIEKLHNFALLADNEAIYRPHQFASRLIGDPVAIATCRALNNFKPLERIVNSLWKDANEDARKSYATAALAEHCYAGGVHYSILEGAQKNPELESQLEDHCPLPLTYVDDDYYVVPLHPAVADRLLKMMAKEKINFLLEIFCNLSKSLSPYVNRSTTIARTPESKLAARLFSAEKVVRPLLGVMAKNFYDYAHDDWRWNPRFWEQRAILTQSENIDLAIQYARHAVAIEDHPFPWTTLASLLSKKMITTKVGLSAFFDEIIDLLTKIIKFESESNSWRPTPHPYSILLDSTTYYISNGGFIAPKRKDWIINKILFCNQNFSRDQSVMSKAETLTNLISPPVVG